MTSFLCLTGGRRSAAAERGEKTHSTSRPWDMAEQSRQGEPWPRHNPRVAPARCGYLAPAARSHRSAGHREAAGKNKWLEVEKMLEAATGGQQVLRRRPGGSGPGQPGLCQLQMWSLLPWAERQERLLGAGMQRCLYQESVGRLRALSWLCQSSSEGKPEFRWRVGCWDM